MDEIIPQSIEEMLRSADECSPELQELMRNARRASDFLKVLAHESRLIVLCLLSARERSVSELNDVMREVQRGLRDEFTERISELFRTYTESAQQAQLAAQRHNESAPARCAAVRDLLVRASAARATLGRASMP